MTNIKRLDNLLENATAMADNLLKCPGNEQNIGNTQAAAAQAIRDLVEAIRELQKGVSGGGPA